MRPMIRSVAFLLAVVIMAACQDRTPTAPSNAIADWRAANAASANAEPAPPCVVDIAALNTLADVVFGGGGPNSNSVKSKIDQVDKAMKKGDKAKAAEHAFNAVRFIFQKFRGPQKLAGTPAQVGQLISGIFCLANIKITVSDPNNASVIDPSNSTQTVKSADSTAGTQLPGGSITEPTVLEFKKVPNIYVDSAPGRGPLGTRLDQYPGFFLITAGSASGAGPAKKVAVAICLDPSISLLALPNSVRRRLRLGHQKTSGFEIADTVSGSFLKCPAPPVSVGFLPGWMNKALGMLLPRTLYAAAFEEDFLRGVGGLATEFSPFDPVDPELSFDRGVGGLATEFKRSGVDATGTVRLRPSLDASSVNPGVLATPGLTANVAVGPTATCAAGFPWSTLTTPACQPDITVRTRLLTLMRGVPVSWSIGSGVGKIAKFAVGTACADVPDTAFHANAATTTDSTTGRTGVCWKMGPTPVVNTVSATPSVGGDAEPGVVFVPATGTFTATAIMRTPVVNINCMDAVYNGSPHACTAAATDPVAGGSLGTVPLDVTYVGTAPVTVPTTTAPTDAGTYTANASYGGSPLLYYFPAVTPPPKTFQITRATPLVTAIGETVTYDGFDHPGSGTCTPGPVPARSYSSGSVPRFAGKYTLTVTCGDGEVNYNTASATATITIDMAGPIRVAAVGANSGLQAANEVFSSGDLPGTITRLNTTQFNALSPDSLRKLFDVIIVTWASPVALNVDWATRLLPYLQLGGGVIYDGDPNNMGDLSALVGAAFVGTEVSTGIEVTTAVAGLTDGITNFFANNHVRFATFPAWNPALSPFLKFTSGPSINAVVGLYGRFGGGCIVLTGPDQDFHSHRGAPDFEGNQYNLLVNELRFVRSCP